MEIAQRRDDDLRALQNCLGDLSGFEVQSLSSHRRTFLSDLERTAKSIGCCLVTNDQPVQLDRDPNTGNERLTDAYGRPFTHLPRLEVRVADSVNTNEVPGLLSQAEVTKLSVDDFFRYFETVYKNNERRAVLIEQLQGFLNGLNDDKLFLGVNIGPKVSEDERNQQIFNRKKWFVAELNSAMKSIGNVRFICNACCPQPGDKGSKKEKPVLAGLGVQKFGNSTQGQFYFFHKQKKPGSLSRTISHGITKSLPELRIRIADEP